MYIGKFRMNLRQLMFVVLPVCAVFFWYLSAIPSVLGENVFWGSIKAGKILLLGVWDCVSWQAKSHDVIRSTYANWGAFYFIGILVGIATQVMGLLFFGGWMAANWVKLSD